MQHMVDKTFHFRFVADDDYLCYVKLLQHITHPVELFRTESISRLIQNKYVTSLDAMDDIMNHFIQSEPISKRSACTLSTAQITHIKVISVLFDNWTKSIINACSHAFIRNKHAIPFLKRLIKFQMNAQHNFAFHNIHQRDKKLIKPSAKS